MRFISILVAVATAVIICASATQAAVVRESAASANAGEIGFHAVCAASDRAFCGTYTAPARLVAYHVSNNTRIDGVTLAAGINQALGCVISPDGATMIASMDSVPAKFVKHNVIGLSQAASPLSLNSGENSGRHGASDSMHVYFALYVSPAKCAKIQWSDNTRVAVITMSSGENLGFGLDIDTASNDLVMSTETSPAYAIKISTSPTFARTSSVLLSSGENNARFLTIADGFSFVPCWVSPGRVVKVNIESDS